MYRFVCATAPCSFALAPVATAQSTDAQTADLRGRVSDLQSRMTEIETQAEPQIGTDQENVRLTFRRRINQSVLFASQGDNDEAFIADKDASGTRLASVAGTFVLGPASLLPEPELSFTGAASQGNLDRSGVHDPNAYFIKVVRFFNFIDLGETRFSLDYSRGENVPDVADPGGSDVLGI